MSKMTDEELRAAETLIRCLETNSWPMHLYKAEKDVIKKALKNLIKTEQEERK